MLDKILGSVVSGVLGGEAGKQGQAMAVINELLVSQGGIQGILAKFQQGGLDDLLQSWLGTGENKRISPTQIEDVFGKQELQQAAQQAGVKDEAEASDLLSQFLPQIVDKLSPNGALDKNADNDLLSKGIQSVLNNFLK
ncbi:YidB family protein [Testudinibacter sp. P80/BLE/0925]|uniref:YidB family protein n=1 Tax=Testudinibacter sp. TW-1 TaxID=3417757 RepID=UPI003D36FCC4